MNIILIGLSDKINHAPLDSATKSGALIDKIIDKLEYKCVKLNLVNYAPIDDNGKLRYPNKDEIINGYKKIKFIINQNQPCIVVCLGRIVADFLDTKLDNIIKIKHPSYISVYKKQFTNQYILESVEAINKMIQKNHKTSCKLS